MFVEVCLLLVANLQGPEDAEPLIGGTLAPAGLLSCSTSFSRTVHASAPSFAVSLPAFLSHFRSVAACVSPVVRRSYAWSCSPPSAWRHRILGKEELRERQPVLFMLQGFSAVPLWGPSQSPLRSLNVTLRMPAVAAEATGDFDPRQAESLHLQAETVSLRRLPLTSIWAAWRRCWRAALTEGDRHILYNAGQRVYNQLTRDTNETTGGCWGEASRSGVARDAVVGGGPADGRGRASEVRRRRTR